MLVFFKQLFRSSPLMTNNMRLKEAYIKRVNNGKFFYSYYTYNIMGDNRIALFTDDFMPAQHGANSNFFISNKNHPNNKVKTDNSQGNIGHNTLMFPNGEFYDYNTDPQWQSESSINYDMFEYVLKSSKVDILQKFKLIEHYRGKRDSKEYSKVLERVEPGLTKEIKRFYPEYLI